MVELTTRYISHSCHCKVSNMPCLPWQYSRIPLQLKKFFTKFNYACEIRHNTKNILNSDGNASINVLEKSCGPQTHLQGPTGCTSLLYTLFICDVDYMASKDIRSKNDVFRARTEAVVSTLKLYMGCPNKSARFTFVIKRTIYFKKSADIFISV
jgi:hypothetical protein